MLVLVCAPEKDNLRELFGLYIDQNDKLSYKISWLSKQDIKKTIDLTKPSLG